MKLRTVIAALALIAGGTTPGAEPPAAPSATPVKHPTLKSCNKEATAKQLSGKQREQFVKECAAGKSKVGPQPAAH
jgi:hypothetical protein